MHTEIEKGLMKDLFGPGYVQEQLHRKIEVPKVLTGGRTGDLVHYTECEQMFAPNGIPHGVDMNPIGPGAHDLYPWPEQLEQMSDRERRFLDTLIRLSGLSEGKKVLFLKRRWGNVVHALEKQLTAQGKEVKVVTELEDATGVFEEAVPTPDNFDVVFSYAYNRPPSNWHGRMPNSRPDLARLKAISFCNLKIFLTYMLEVSSNRPITPVTGFASNEREFRSVLAAFRKAGIDQVTLKEGGQFSFGGRGSRRIPTIETDYPLDFDITMIQESIPSHILVHQDNKGNEWVYQAHVRPLQAGRELLGYLVKSGKSPDVKASNLTPATIKSMGDNNKPKGENVTNSSSNGSLLVYLDDKGNPVHQYDQSRYSDRPTNGQIQITLSPDSLRRAKWNNNTFIHAVNEFLRNADVSGVIHDLRALKIMPADMYEIVK